MSTIVTIRPTTLITYTRATLTGAADRASATNDNSDSSYVGLYNSSGQTTPSFVRPRMTVPTIPGGTVIIAVTPRVRLNPGGNIESGYAYTNLRVGGSSGASFGDEFLNGAFYAGNSSYTTVTGVRHTVQPDGSAWNTAALANLYLEVGRYVVASGFSGFGTALNVAEIYLDVEYNYPPTATGSGPNGNSGTSRPVFTWTYADTESDAQSLFRVRVFSSAQINASGFDPNISTPTADSGVITSSTSSWQCTTDLANGITYRAYIAVQDAVSNTWSTYNVYGPYAYVTIVLIAPAVPELTITPNNSNKSSTLLLQARENLLYVDDADFESSLQSWVNSNNAILAWSADYANYNSTHSMKMTANADSTGSYTAAQTAIITATSVVPGQTYSGCAAVYKPSGTSRKIRVDIYWYDGLSNYVDTTIGADVTQIIGTWTYGFVTGVVPVGAVFARLWVSVSDMTASEVQYIDSAAIVPFTINMLENPIFEVDSDANGLADDWGVYNYNIGADPVYSIDSTPGNYIAGNQSQKMVWSGNNGSKGILTSSYVRVKVGFTYTLSMWIKTDRASTSMRMYHAGLTTPTYATVAANTWTRVSFVLPALSTTTSAVFIGSDDAAMTLWVGQAQCEIGVTMNREICNRHPWTRGGLLTPQRFQVQRSYDQITWTDITNRLIYNADLTLPTASVVNVNISDYYQNIFVYEYDMQLKKTIYYRIRSIANVDGNTIISQWSKIYTLTDTVLTPDPLKWWFKVPEIPALNFSFYIKGTDNDGAAWKRRRQEAAAFFSPISRNRQVKVRDVIYGDEFTLLVTGTTQAEFTAFDAIQAAQHTILIQSFDGRQWFADFTTTTTFNEIATDVVNPYREIEIGLIEVDAPYI